VAFPEANGPSIERTSHAHHPHYPLSRQLLVYEATGRRTPSRVEAELLDYLLDRSYMDPIIRDHDFHTLD
jgi:hypothetical protein